jgi:RNA polymerase sigma factor (sigma-70 family)
MKPMTPPTPEPCHAPSLLAEVAAGEPEAIDQWYRAEFPMVHRLALGFLADPGEAQDVAQDAMVRIMNRLETDPLPEKYAPWRTSVVINLCRDRRRQGDSRRRAEASVSLPAALPNPHDAAAQGEVRQILVTALRSLSSREREVFVLRDLEGGTFEDIGSLLGIQPGTVRTLLSLAHRRLRNLLAPHLATNGGGESLP